MEPRAAVRPTMVAAFTLVELMISVTILVLLMLLFATMVSQTGKIWNYTREEMGEFRSARNGFEALTRRLSLATLNTYWGYDNPASPQSYIRQSELRFISGPNLAGNGGSTPPRPTHAIFFQAPLGYVAPASVNDTTYTNYTGLGALLNTWGYFIEFNSDNGSDTGSAPSFIKSPPNYRFRLMELMEPAQSMNLYQLEINAGGNLSYTGQDWFLGAINATTSAPVHVLADNIIALILLPKLSPAMQTAGTNTFTNASLAPTYLYDSTGTGMSTLNDPNLDPKNQLPPIVQVTMVAVDEASYARYQAKQTGTSLPPLYDPSLFTAAANYSTDLQTLESDLQNNHLHYRVFTTDVSIRGAQWSTAETQ